MSLEVRSLLTTRLFEVRDKSLRRDIEFLKVHPASRYPDLWMEKISGRRAVDKCITTAYCTFLALMHQTEIAKIGDFKYHYSGIGVVGEDPGDTDLGTPKEAARDIGTQVAAGVTYTSVATTTYVGTWAITEHGIFNDPGVGGPPVTGPTLLDRSVFAAINVIPTNQIEWTYVITFVGPL